MTKLDEIGTRARHPAMRVSEAAWQALVVEAALWLKWWVFHPYDSRRSSPGWPDLALVRPPRLVLAELKTERGRVTREQANVLDLLGGCPGVEVYLWRPSDWPEVERVLR